MTVDDMMKRLKKMDGDKMIIFSFGIGWTNIDIEDTENEVIIRCSSNSPFTDEN